MRGSILRPYPTVRDILDAEVIRLESAAARPVRVELLQRCVLIRARMTYMNFVKPDMMIGAGEGSRTLYPHDGNVALYR